MANFTVAYIVEQLIFHDSFFPTGIASILFFVYNIPKVVYIKGYRIFLDFKVSRYCEG